MSTLRCDKALKKFSPGVQKARRGMALALVIGMAAVLFVGLASLTFITREETGQASKFIFNIKAECLSEAIHTFLLSESFAYSWDDRFYKDRQIFSSEAGGLCTYPVELMKKSIKRIIENDPVLKNTVGFDGYIESETIEGMRVIIICVNITLRVSMLKNDVISTQTYYDLYKRDLLDSLGETITFFYSESGDKQKKIGQDIKKSLGGSLSFENEVERRVKMSREDRKKIPVKGKGKDKDKDDDKGKGGGKGK